MISKIILFLIFLVPVGSLTAIAGENPDFQVYENKGVFTDVRENLIDAIINRGYVLDFNGRVGDMLKRTRKDVGGKPLYSDAEYMVFCSAVLSRNTMEADIHNIGYCPYALFVYETVANPGTIYVSYRKPTSGGSTDSTIIAVEKLLDELALEAIE
jgi:hypothetical protein